MHVSISTLIQLLKLTKRTVKRELKLLNVVPFETHISVFWLKCSAMGDPYRYVYAHNLVQCCAI